MSCQAETHELEWERCVDSFVVAGATRPIQQRAFLTNEKQVNKGCGVQETLYPAIYEQAEKPLCFVVCVNVKKESQRRQPVIFV